MRKIAALLLLAIAIASIAPLIATSTQATGIFLPKFKYETRIDSAGIHTIVLDKDDTYATEIELHFRSALGKTDFSVYHLRREPTTDFALPVRRILQYIAIENEDVGWYDLELSVLTIEFNKTQLTQRNVGPSQVIMFYYNSQENEWQKLDTTLISESSQKVTYTASSPHIGYFAVGVLDDNELATSGSLITDAIEEPEEPHPSQPREDTADAAQSDLAAETLDIVEQRSEEPLQPDVFAPDPQTGQTEQEPVQVTQLDMSQYIMIGAAGLIFATAMGVLIWQLIVLSKPKKKAKKFVEHQLKDILEKHAKQTIPKPPLPPRKEGGIKIPFSKKSVTQEPMAAQFGMDHKIMHNQIKELQGNLASIQHMSLATNTLSQKNQENMQELVDAQLPDMKAKLEEVEPKIIKTFIDTEKSKGKNVDEIIGSLMTAGFDEGTIRRYIT